MPWRDQHEARALVRHSGQPQMVSQSCRLADHRRYDGRDGLAAAAHARVHRVTFAAIPAAEREAKDGEKRRNNKAAEKGK